MPRVSILIFVAGNRLRNNRVRTGQARGRRQGQGSTNSDQSVSGERRNGIELQKYDAKLKGSTDDEKSTTTTQRLYSGAIALGTSAAAAVGLTSDRTIMVQTLGSEKQSSREKGYSAQAQTTVTNSSTAPHATHTSNGHASADIETGFVGGEDQATDTGAAAAHPSLGNGPLAGSAAAAMLLDPAGASAIGTIGSRRSPTLDLLGAGGPIPELSEEEKPSPEQSPESSRHEIV